MKRKLITLTILGALTLGSLAWAEDAQESKSDRWERHGGRGHRMSLERMAEQLNLTPEQKAKVQPILDQVRPQLETIHREAMERSRVVMENAISQIRPVLTPEQQKQLEDAKNDLRERKGERGHHRRHRGQDGQDEPDDD